MSQPAAEFQLSDIARSQEREEGAEGRRLSDVQGLMEILREIATMPSSVQGCGERWRKGCDLERQCYAVMPNALP